MFYLAGEQQQGDVGGNNGANTRDTERYVGRSTYYVVRGTMVVLRKVHYILYTTHHTLYTGREVGVSK